MYGLPRALSPPLNSPAAAAPWLRAALALALAAAVLMALVAAGWHPLLRVDGTVAVRLHSWALHHPGWTETNRVLSDWVWDPLTMRLVLLAAALWLWLRGERLLALWCVATAAVGTGLQQGLKTALDRERPHWQHPVDSAHYSAMPSGHAMTAMITYFLAVWLVRRSGAPARAWVPVLALGCVTVVGVCLTRIALGVHWLTDTVAGSLLGAALAAAAVGVWNAWLPAGPRNGPGEGRGPDAPEEQEWRDGQDNDRRT